LTRDLAELLDAPVRADPAFDAVPLSILDDLDHSGAPEILTFYDLVVFGRGRGTVELGGESATLEPGLVACGRPGDLRVLDADRVEASRLRFTAVFVEDQLRVRAFVDGLRCFAPGRPAALCRLVRTDAERIHRVVAHVTARAAAESPDGFDGLRAALEELLLAVDRAYRAEHSGRRSAPASAEDPLARFLAAVERDLGHGRTLEEYATEVGLSPSRLSALCRERLRTSAAKWIRRRIALEARRLLVHTDLPSGQVGERLGFDDSGYFARFVQRETKLTPSAHRDERPARRRA